MAERVVITGIGAVTPVGLDRETTWQALLAGRSGVGPLTAFDASGLSTRIAAQVTGFDPANVLEGKRLRRSARFTQFAVAAAREAVLDAALTVDASNSFRVAVVVNAAVAGFDTIEAATRSIDAGRRLSPYFVASSLTNMPALRDRHRPGRARTGHRQRPGLRERHVRAGRGPPAAAQRGRRRGDLRRHRRGDHRELLHRAGDDGRPVQAQRRARCGQPSVRRGAGRLRLRRGLRDHGAGDWPNTPPGAGPAATPRSRAGR